MTEADTNLNSTKSKALVLLENFLLILCLCIIALRTTLTEALFGQSDDSSTGLADIIYGLSTSAILLFVFVCYFLWRLCSDKFLRRFSTMAAGVVLFSIAALASSAAAANKSAAMTASLFCIAPVAAAIFLVWILDSGGKIKLLLTVLVSLGVVCAWQCKEQLFYWNSQQIQFYESDPAPVLAQQNISPGSLGHWQFEHRLYSGGASGFFTNRNSAGSFFLLSLFAAVALIIERLKDIKSKKSGVLLIIPPILAAAAILFGLAVTKSKGAIAGAALACLMLTVYLKFKGRLIAHKKALIVICITAVIAGVSVFVGYGLTHQQPPGGGSMLVRWQYWTASAKMVADYPLLGIGGGNFGCHYPHYKNAAALEVVSDPHNFCLSILTQYGPLGLIGFLALIVLPMWRIISPKTPALPQRIKSKSDSRTLAVISVIAVSAALLFIRPLVLTIPTAGSAEEKKAASIILYVMPTLVFAVSFFLLSAGTYASKNSAAAKTDKGTVTVAVIFCACVGFLAHNLIDFAIFEPGIYTTFWALMAVMIAASQNHNAARPKTIKLNASSKAALAAAGVVAIWACVNYVVLPPVKAGLKSEKAKQSAELGRFLEAHNLLAEAARDDLLSPAAASVNAGVYLRQYQEDSSGPKALLLKAESSLLEASARNRADYKYHHRLVNIYQLLADSSSETVKTDWLNRAYDASNRAAFLYPGSGKIRFELALIAEKLGKTDIAVTNYTKAVEIEDTFQKQFEKMYPEYEIINRLGQENYQTAKQRLKQLTK